MADAPPARSGPGERRRLLESLAGSLPDRLRWDGGWRVREREGTVIVVEKDGLRIWARAGEWRPDVARPAAPGSRGRLRVPADRWSASAGYLYVEGCLLPAADPIVPRTRIYLNADVHGAHALLQATAEWNAARLPFVLKVLADPRGYDRCDSAILIVEGEDADRARERVLARVRLRSLRLRPETPAFTLSVFPGMSVAADPPDCGSFGMLRCRQLAEGIVRAGRGGARSLPKRIEVVEERFAEEGHSLDALHLGVVVGGRGLSCMSSDSCSGTGSARRTPSVPGG